MRPLRIIVAEDEPDMRAYLVETLTEEGHTVLFAAEDGQQLAEACLQQMPDLVMSDIKMPRMSGLEAATLVTRSVSLPWVLISAFHDQELLQQTADLPVFGYLVKPIQRPQLTTTLAIAWQQFEQFSAVRDEAASLRQALADRKIIERAKGLLMKSARLGEREAFQRMQRTARDENRKLVEVAQSLITAHKAMGLDSEG